MALQTTPAGVPQGGEDRGSTANAAAGRIPRRGERSNDAGSASASDDDGVPAQQTRTDSVLAKTS